MNFLNFSLKYYINPVSPVQNLLNCTSNIHIEFPGCVKLLLYGIIIKIKHSTLGHHHLESELVSYLVSSCHGTSLCTCIIFVGR